MVSPGRRVNHVHELLEYPGMFLGYHLLCALAEEAMLEVLPSLSGKKGVINLLEAGNWQLQTNRDPVGQEKGASLKSVHAHLYGRSPLEPGTNEYKRQLHWGWGEAPFFPAFRDTPFSPRQEKKNWVVPEQFNETEITDLREHIAQKANDIAWDSLVEAQQQIEGEPPH